MDKVLNDVKLRCRQISACTRLRDSVKFSFFSNMAERLANNSQKWMKIGKIHPCIYSKKSRPVHSVTLYKEIIEEKKFRCNHCSQHCRIF